VNTGTGREPTLADIEREFSGYECWRGASGLYYARLPGRPRRHKADVCGEDPRDLRDQIIRHKAQTNEEAWKTAQTPEPPGHRTPD
jgi:hypothetical protein